MAAKSRGDGGIYYPRQQTIHSHSVILLLTDSERSIFTRRTEGESGGRGRGQMAGERGTEEARGGEGRGRRRDGKLGWREV